MNKVDVAAGAAIRARRLHLGLSQQEVAGKMEVQQSAIAKWERGDVPMRLRDAVGICDVLGVSLGELWNGPKGRDRFKEGVQRGLELSRQALEGLSRG